MWLIVLTMDAMMSEPTNEKYSVHVSPHFFSVRQESRKDKDDANQEQDGDGDRAEILSLHLTRHATFNIWPEC
jgi:hypothetical protein